MANPVTLWEPSNVLYHIDNSSCDITCVGWAPSKGRRCQNRIAAINRQEAAKLVARMSRLDISSRRVTGLLQNLAPRVLCKAYHQNQCSDMVTQWQANVDRCFVDSRAVGAEIRREEEAARQAEEEARRERRRFQRAEEDCLVRESAQLREELRRHREAAQQAEQFRGQQELVRRAEHTRQVQQAARQFEEAKREQEASHRAEREQLNAELALMRARLGAAEEEIRELRRRIPLEQPGRHPSDTIDQDLALEADELVIAPVSPVSTPNEHVEMERIPVASTPDEGEEDEQVPLMAASVERVEEESAPPILTPYDDVPEEREDQEHGTIEGDCSICLESLGDENDLARCNIQCGQNFHLDCIGIWLASAEYTHTCPCCRADWAD